MAHEVDASPAITPAEVAKFESDLKDRQHLAIELKAQRLSQLKRPTKSAVTFRSDLEFKDSLGSEIDELSLKPEMISRASTIEPDSIPDLLASVNIFSKFTEEQIEDIANKMSARVFKPGDIIMKAYEAGDEFFVVQQGICAQTSHTGRHLDDLYEGDYFGEQALLKKTKRITTVKAITHAICLVLDSTTFNTFVREVFQASESTPGALNRNITAHKRKAFLTNASGSTRNLLPVYDTTKTELTRKWLQRVIQSNHLFENFNNDQQEHIVDVMYRQTFKQGQVVINEGDVSDQYYVVERGSFDVSVAGMGVVNEVTPGVGFGVKGLLGDEPRTASVTAVRKRNVVWTLGRTAFRTALQKVGQQKMKNEIRMLQDVKIFHHLRVEELVLLEEALTISVYEPGHLLIRQGDPPDKFYIIKKGTATWTKIDENGTESTGDMHDGCIFGEVALLDDSVRAATVRAKTQLVVWEMMREDFTELLGPYMEIEARARHAERFILSPSSKANDAELRRFPSIRARNVSSKALNAGGICALEKLELVGLLGKGAFGAVTLVIDPNTENTYALKTIKKARVVETGTQEYIVNEKEIMVKLESRFCVNLEATYKDEKHVYFLLQVCLGGDMFALLQQERFLEVEAARFYAGCVIEAFEHMHSFSIIYRDLKPENLVLDENGYLLITDFGFAKQVGEERTYTFCGTPEYLAPEMIKGDGHGKGLDWWTLGILIFEMLTSTTPFAAPDTFDITRKILKSQISFPKYFTSQTKTLLLGLLRKKPHRRLGVKAGGADMIRKHPWFEDLDWESLRDGILDAPLDPDIENNTDLSNFQNEDDSEDESETESINSSDDDFCDGF